MGEQQKDDRKMWPVFILVAMFVMAGFFWVEDLLFPEDKTEEALAGEPNSENNQVAINTRENNIVESFNVATWPMFDTEPADMKELPTLKSYSKADLVVYKTEGPAVTRQYAEDLKYALEPYSNPNMPSEVDALMYEYEQGDGEGIKSLQRQKEVHALATAAIAKLSVPKSMTTYHLAVLNSTSRMQYLTENMLQVNENPLLALTSARMFGKEGAHFIEAMTVVNNSLANQGIFADEVAGKKLYVNTTEL